MERDLQHRMQGLDTLSYKALRNQSASSHCSLGNSSGKAACADIAVDVSGCHEEAHGATIRISDGMELGVHATLSAGDQPPGTPLSTHTIIHSRLAIALRKIRLKPSLLLVHRPVQVVPLQSPSRA